MTCKNCIHYEVCTFHIDEETNGALSIRECKDYKPKSNYLDLYFELSHNKRRKLIHIALQDRKRYIVAVKGNKTKLDNTAE